MDKERFIELWAEAFGDSREDIELFFDIAYRDGAYAETVVDGKTAAVMYLLEDQKAIRKSDNKTYKLTYLYALATFKEYRGQGIGGATFKKAAELAFMRGADIVALCPANAGLVKWYHGMGLDQVAVKAGECAEEEMDIFTMEFSDGYKGLHNAYMQYPEYAAINEDERVILYKTREDIDVEKLYFSPILF